MNAMVVIEAVLLALGVLVVLVAAIGLWAMETIYDRLHCVGLAAVAGPVTLAVAVLLRIPRCRRGSRCC